MRGIERRDRLDRQRHVLAEQRSQRAVVGLDLVAAQLLGGRHEAHASHVELIAHRVRQRFDRLALAPGGHDDCLRERLAHLDLGLSARAQPEADGLARQRHRLLQAGIALQLLVLGAAVRARPGGELTQVHARQRAVEVVIDLVGDERTQGGEQLCHRDQTGAQRAKGRHVAVPEAAS